MFWHHDGAGGYPRHAWHLQAGGATGAQAEHSNDMYELV